MSIIDRASAKQSKAPRPKPRQPAGKRLAPVPAHVRDKDAILEDIDAWERETGSAAPERTPPRRRAPAPDRAPPEPAPDEAEVKAYGDSFRARKAAAPEPEPQPVPESQPQPEPEQESESKAHAHLTRSREFAFDHKRLEKFGFITPKVRRSRISEEFRLIKRRLMQRMSLSAKKKQQQGTKRGDRNHVILVTSARPSEGKSFVAMNLALSIVFDEGLNVMLVDGDVARPSMSKILGLRNDLPGLTDLLLDDEASLHDVLLREHEHPLTYMAAGAMVASATDLFGGDRMETLVADMAERYPDRIIIFDGPPLLASTEPVALAEHVGQVVMVVDAEKTSRSAVDSALDLLVTDQNVNLVLNKTTVGNRTEQFGSYYEAYNQAQP